MVFLFSKFHIFSTLQLAIGAACAGFTGAGIERSAHHGANLQTAIEEVYLTALLGWTGHLAWNRKLHGAYEYITYFMKYVCTYLCVYSYRQYLYMGRFSWYLSRGWCSVLTRRYFCTLLISKLPGLLRSPSQTMLVQYKETVLPI